MGELNDRCGPAECVLFDLVAAQAARTPDALAITGFGFPSVTYRSLLARAEYLATDLAVQGIQPGELVGVCLPRSPELVIAALAITRAGGAYLPLNSSDPPRRLATLAKDAGLRTVIIDETGRSPIDGVDAIVLGRDAASSALQEDVRARAVPSPSTASPDDIAYMIYTSGSTGTPKGVPTTHAALVELLYWMTRTYPLDTSRRVLLKTSPAFDVSIAEMFWPLASGAALVVPHPAGHKDPAHLAEVMQRFAVTDVFFVPSQIPLFFSEPAAAGCRTLSRLIAAGEELTPATLHRIWDTLPDLRVINAYGPTEAAILTLWHDCTALDAAALRVPIGRPVGRTRVEIVDPRTLEPVPPGTPGELVLEGPQVAHGYHRRQELTSSRFITTPAGQLRYRTGDTARFRDDGLVEFLGREDRQVKINGHRIELAGVEAVLRGAPHVLDTHVAVHTDPAVSAPALVAWVATGPHLVTEAQLRAHMRDHVPDYLTPARIVPLAQFPLLPNGKLDTLALPQPFGATEPTPPRPAPLSDRRPLAQVIADIWRDLTGADQVNPRDGFIDSGGSSLLLLRLRSQLRVIGYPTVRVLDLLAHPTPVALAEFLAAQSRERLPR